MMEGIIALLLLFSAVFIGGLMLWKLFDIVQTSIKKKKDIYDEDLFEQMAQAFIQHKKDTERRLDHIEAFIKEEKAVAGKSRKHSSSSIKIEESGFDENNQPEAVKNINKQRER